MIIFSNNQIKESDEDKPGNILDYDNSGNLVSMEILEASKRVMAPNQMDYEPIYSYLIHFRGCHFIIGDTISYLNR